MIRQPIFPKEGYIFQHKEKTDDFARILYLGADASIDDYIEITESAYQEYREKQKELALGHPSLQ